MCWLKYTDDQGRKRMVRFGQKKESHRPGVGDMKKAILKAGGKLGWPKEKVKA